MNNCAMCGASLTSEKVGDVASLKSQLMVCISCTQKIENYMNDAGVQGGVVNINKWGDNMSHVPLGAAKKVENEQVA